MVNNGVIRLCKICVHYVPHPSLLVSPMSDSPPSCQREIEIQNAKRDASAYIEPIQGKVLYLRQRDYVKELCHQQRSLGWLWARVTGTCGEEGRFFEHKKVPLIPFCGDPEDDPNPPDFEDYV